MLFSNTRIRLTRTGKNIFKGELWIKLGETDSWSIIIVQRKRLKQQIRGGRVKGLYGLKHGTFDKHYYWLSKSSKSYDVAAWRGRRLRCTSTRCNLVRAAWCVNPTRYYRDSSYWATATLCYPNGFIKFGPYCYQNSWLARLSFFIDVILSN